MANIKYGMVGGDLHAFIGEVHRKGIALNHGIDLVAGCFSNVPEYNVETAEVYGVDSARVYDDYKAMAAAEKGKLDFVSICTPNFLHYEISKEFLNAGINVVCEKPLCFEIEQALELEKLAKDKGLLFGVTYTYTGYTMARVARDLIKRGDIGNILTVNAEYAQEWLIDSVGTDSDEGNLSVWRKDPKFSGISNCVGDIGTHIENMVHFMTGLEVDSVSAVLSNYGQPLDLNANMMVKYTNGVVGSYWSSQVAIGHLNGFVVRIFGDKGSLVWEQENPNYITVTMKGCAPKRLQRGTDYLDVPSAGYSRVPFGHPEGFHHGFANIYKDFAAAVAAKKAGEKVCPESCNFPTVSDGVAGVKFVHAVVESHNNGGTWVKVK